MAKIYYKEAIDSIKTLKNLALNDPLLISENDIRISTFRTYYQRLKDEGAIEGRFSFVKVGNNQFVVTRIA